LSHQRGKKPKEKKTKNTTQCPKFKCNTVSVIFQHGGVVWLLSLKTKSGKKRVWRQFCEWLSEAVAYLPTAVSLLLLEAFFMQISGVR
jgi:hypothetical protein